MGFVGFDLFHKGTDYASVAQQQEQQRQAAITKGTADINKAYAGFTPEFYQQRAQAYVDYAMPQVSQQYRQARNQIGFNLANRGLFGGSASGQQFSDLNRTMSQATQGVYDTGQSQAQQLQSNVEAAKNQQLSYLYQSADPSAAGAQAVSSAASFAQPSTFTPVANAFSNLMNQYYYSQLINSYRPTSFVSMPQDQSSSPSIPVTVSGQ